MIGIKYNFYGSKQCWYIVNITLGQVIFTMFRYPLLGKMKTSLFTEKGESRDHWTNKVDREVFSNENKIVQDNINCSQFLKGVAILPELSSPLFF